MTWRDQTRSTVVGLRTRSALLALLIAAGCPSGRVVDSDDDGWTNLEDCNDTDASIFAGAPERCDEVDNDCDGLVDNNVGPFEFYIDADSDGYGGPETVRSCEVLGGTVFQSGDCDDTNSGIHPFAQEVCFDGVDDDCDGEIDESCEIAGLLDVKWEYMAPERAGGVLSRAGDLDADGLDDWVISGSAELGAVLVVLGKSPTESTTSLTSGAQPWYGADGQDAPAAAATGPVDLNADGIDDLLFGATTSSALQPAPGAVWAVFGESGFAGGSTDEADIVVYGGGEVDGAGLCSAGGDIDGDGLPEILIGAPGSDGGTGAAWLLPGAGLASEQTLNGGHPRLVGNGPGDAFGSLVEIVPDIDGDGFADVMVGAGGLGAATRWGILLFTGGPWAGDLTSVAAAAHIDPGRGPGTLGRQGDTKLADLDGDGARDVLTTNGQQFLVFSNAAVDGYRENNDADLTIDAAPGASAAHAPEPLDADGDGTWDLALGGPAANVGTAEPGVVQVFLDVGPKMTGGVTPPRTSPSSASTTSAGSAQAF